MSKCCGQKDVLLLACSGGSNVGKIANDVAITLDQLGVGSMYCNAGIAAQLPSFVERSQRPGTSVVGIDGCSVGCVKKALENIGITPAVYVDVTSLGIEKAHCFDKSKEEVGRIAKVVADLLPPETYAG